MPTTIRWSPPMSAFRPFPTCLMPSSWNRIWSSNSIRVNDEGPGDGAFRRISKAAPVRRGFFHALLSGSGGRRGSDEAQALQAGMAVLADDDVIVDGDAERHGGLDDGLRHVDIGA